MEAAEPQQARRGRPVFRSQSYASLEQTASYYRNQWAPGLEPDGPFPCPEVFSRLHESRVMLGPNIGILLTDDVFKDHYGELGHTVFNKASRRIVVGLSEDQYFGMERGDGRSRHSLCHELAHAAVQADYLVALAYSEPAAQLALARTAGGNHKIFVDSEWQADSAAVALLAPANGLESLRRQGRLDIRTVAGRFGISLEAADYRIKNFVKRADALLQACVRAKREGPSW